MGNSHESDTNTDLDVVHYSVNWHLIRYYVDTHQYAHATRLLIQAEQALRAIGQEWQADVLAMLRHICLSCSQNHRQADWLATMREDVLLREVEMQQLFLALVRQLATDGRGAGLLAHITSLEARWEANPYQFGWANVRQFVSGLLGNRNSDLIMEGQSSQDTGATLVRPAGGVEEFEPVPENEMLPVMLPSLGNDAGAQGPTLAVYCLGQFQVFQDHEPVEGCSSRKGRAVFKYLLAHRKNPISREVLMDCFWPDSTPDAARNNLNVAVYNLRQSLPRHDPDFSHVLFTEGMYSLNPNLVIWSDFEEFQARARQGRVFEQAGQMRAAIDEFSAAELLYQGPFLQEDVYDDWCSSLRQSLQDIYINVLETLSEFYLQNSEFPICIATCHKILTIEPCIESVHRRLMSAYARQGQRHLALRQYHLCQRSLREELDVQPAQATRALFDHLRRSDPV